MPKKETPEEQAKREDEIAERLRRQAEEKELQRKHDLEEKALARKQEAEDAAKEVSPSKAEYKKLLEAYKKQNPIKYELKKAELERKLAAL